MARRKIKVVVNRPRKPLVMGDFSKILFITKEADKDYNCLLYTSDAADEL